MDKQQIEKDEEEGGKVNWLDLPDHLIASITDRFFLVKDYICFGAVCRSWRSVYTDNLDQHCPPRRLPLLMVPPTDKERDDIRTRSLYSISDNEVIPNIKVNVPHDRFCRGSSEGWLITLHQNQNIHLLHPFSGVEIELPPSTALPHEEGDNFNEGFIDKAILSGNPSSNGGNYFVMVIYGQFNRLALFKPGGDPTTSTWTPLDFSFNVMEDVIYCRDSFYAVDFYGQIYAYDPNHPHPELVKLEQLPGEFMPMDKRKYLVDSDGDLLLIARLINMHEDDDSYHTCSFEVFKLKHGSSSTTSTWTPLQNLKGQAVFLGTNSSMSILASDFPGCRPDCIYFTDDDFELCSPPWKWRS